MVYITEVHMNGAGGGHEHIAAVRWRDPDTDEVGESTLGEIVPWVGQGGDARVLDRGRSVRVCVIDANPPYLRTYADGVATDNLLALDRY